MKGYLSPEERKQRIEEETRRIEENMKNIHRKILVLSGKGGVGKTTVAVNLSVGLAEKGYEVGILDVDIHGPNVPKMLGLEEEKLGLRGGRITPIFWKENLKVVSMAFLLEKSYLPVIWRGPLKTGVIRQFLADVDWGKLDYLIVDSPPGTGDEPLSVLQLIPSVDAAIVVTTPQEVSLLDCGKAVRFAKELKVNKVGVVENMRGLICPYCGKEIFLFKKGGGEKLSREFEVEFLGDLPIEPEVVEGGDKGRPVFFYGKRMKEKLRRLMEKVEEWLK